MKIIVIYSFLLPYNDEHGSGFFNSVFFFFVWKAFWCWYEKCAYDCIVMACWWEIYTLYFKNFHRLDERVETNWVYRLNDRVTEFPYSLTLSHLRSVPANDEYLTNKHCHLITIKSQEMQLKHTLNFHKCIIHPKCIFWWMFELSPNRIEKVSRNEKEEKNIKHIKSIFTINHFIWEANEIVRYYLSINFIATKQSKWELIFERIVFNQKALFFSAASTYSYRSIYFHFFFLVSSSYFCFYFYLMRTNLKATQCFREN